MTRRWQYPGCLPCQMLGGLGTGRACMARPAPECALPGAVRRLRRHLRSRAHATYCVVSGASQGVCAGRWQGKAAACFNTVGCHSMSGVQHCNCQTCSLQINIQHEHCTRGIRVLIRRRCRTCAVRYLRRRRRAMQYCSPAGRARNRSTGASPWAFLPSSGGRSCRHLQPQRLSERIGLVQRACCILVKLAEQGLRCGHTPR